MQILPKEKEKFQIGKSELNCFGHIVSKSKDGIKPGENKVIGFTVLPLP